MDRSLDGYLNDPNRQCPSHYSHVQPNKFAQDTGTSSSELAGLDLHCITSHLPHQSLNGLVTTSLTNLSKPTTSGSQRQEGGADFGIKFSGKERVGNYLFVYISERFVSVAPFVELLEHGVVYLFLLAWLHLSSGLCPAL